MTAARPPRPHKYGAVATTFDGIRFASKREASRYHHLKLLERAGKVAQIELHPKFALHVLGKKIGYYEADFRFYNCETGETEVWDAKGVRTPLYRWKKRHVETEYGIVVKEV